MTKEKSVLNPEHIVLISSLRIPEKEREDNLYYYDIRHDNECGFTPIIIANFILINHMFTIALKEKVDLGKENYLYLTEKDEDILLSMF